MDMSETPVLLNADDGEKSCVDTSEQSVHDDPVSSVPLAVCLGLQNVERQTNVAVRPISFLSKRSQINAEQSKRGKTVEKSNTLSNSINHDSFRVGKICTIKHIFYFTLISVVYCYTIKFT